MEQLQNLTRHPTVLALFASPASLVVVYSDNGSKMSRCVNVSKILRQVTVTQLQGGGHATVT